MSKIKLTQAKIDEAQAVLEAMAEELGCSEYSTTKMGGVFGINVPDGSPSSCSLSSVSLYDAYINALHAKAGTTPPLF